MKATGNTFLHAFRDRWQRLLYLRSLCYALGAGLCAGLLMPYPWAGPGVFLLVLLAAIGVSRPWTRTLERSSRYIDAHLEEAAYSSGLLAVPDNQLTGLSRLQKYRVAEHLPRVSRKLHPPTGIKTAISWLVLLLIAGLAGRQLNLPNRWDLFTGPRDATPESIRFAPVDSTGNGKAVPELDGQRITISFPGYTGQPAVSSENPNIRALAGSVIRWQLQFTGPVDSVWMESMGAEHALRKNGQEYGLERPLRASGFYNFRYRDTLGRSYVSDLFSIEAVPDREPEIAIEGVPQYTYFEGDDPRQFAFTGRISDDYGIGEAAIVATVSKGSGESVKFREERLAFDGGFRRGARELQLPKTIFLDSLRMEPGDELYFYIEASDLRVPEPNVARSETFFAVIRDTVTDSFAVEGSLGVDQMPAYFRSQRQLIIDTERLIAEKPGIPEKEFKFRSNELGFDQKSLRLKYGQFMGDEAEMEMAPAPGGQSAGVEADGEEVTAGAEDGTGSEDPLDAYTHDHDGDNEHQLVSEEAGDAEGEEADPLHEYLHNHADPEESTLFEESLKTKLRKALNIMWDAELQLRLYQPEKSLPYQYAALKLIQEIKNSARVYVHRIGFDPPPIKEDRRLSGDISEIADYRKKESVRYEPQLAAVREAVRRLEELLGGGPPFGEGDLPLFKEAGNELAEKAVAEPGRYLGLLRSLKGLERVSGRAPENYRSLRKGLLGILPEPEKTPTASPSFPDPVNALLLKELRIYDK
ncbi:DUF4175 family protein [Robiginitalea sp. SC105]|uniref:DUF4175 family protein n=1 Tax=Robiginitalea sp. SC105 TaxID=2762332 RepID=UPI00163A5528|nr:DUF4175 family protein [Robiginitalea sp. SC105]MBC2839521.1 tryptophan-rich sensory protein [Robiginitalea sp. SC105]